MNKDEQFIYSYSAKQQDEVRYIKEKYVKSEKSNINNLRELDKSVERKAYAASVLMGIVGFFSFGGGFSMIMTTHHFIFRIMGTVIAVLGIIVCVATYFCYPRILGFLRKRYAPLIVKMCDEILENPNK